MKHDENAIESVASSFDIRNEKKKEKEKEKEKKKSNKVKRSRRERLLARENNALQFLRSLTKGSRRARYWRK